MHKKRFTLSLSKGFTLIELLVVIAIIGFLASVVLASLNSARAKGADAAVKASLANTRAQAEILYDTDSDYDAVCGANGVTQNSVIASAITAANTTSGHTAVCGKPATGAASAWAISEELKSSTTGTPAFWCVDSEGASKSTTATIAATTTVCP